MQRLCQEAEDLVSLGDSCPLYVVCFRLFVPVLRNISRAVHILSLVSLHSECYCATPALAEACTVPMERSPSSREEAKKSREPLVLK